MTQIKTKQVGFRASPEEYEIIHILAARERRTPSEMLRETVREAAEKRGFLPAGLIELEKIGLRDGNKTI